MNKNELKECINNTIVQNDERGITAEALNLILNEIVDSTEESNDENNKGCGIPIVNSVKELENLDVPVGSIASIVGSGSFKFSDIVPNYSNEEEFFNLPIVTNIRVAPVQENTIFTTCHVMLVGGLLSRIMLLGVGKMSEDSENYVIIAIHQTTDGSNPEITFIYDENGQYNDRGLARVNKLLSESDYRYVGKNLDVLNTTEELIALDKVFTLGYESASAYIKGDNWERLAVEKDLSIKDPSNVVISFKYIAPGTTASQQQHNMEAYTRLVHFPNACVNITFEEEGALRIFQPVHIASKEDEFHMLIVSMEDNQPIYSTVIVDREGTFNVSDV